MIPSRPIASFITFTTFGTWLHGDQRGSVIKIKETTKLIEPNLNFQNHQLSKMKLEPVIFDNKQRKIVRDAIVEHCEFKKWQLYALHVRSNHVHILLKADKDDLIADIKSWATRKLKQAGYHKPKFWSRGGSLKHILNEEKMREKIDYIINQQGEMMEYYVYSDSLLNKK